MTQDLLTSAELTDSQFESIRRMVRQLSGINLHNGKMALVKARLNKRLRLLGLQNFGQYLERVIHDATGRETTSMLDALSTNLTYFFREAKHFEALRQSVLPGAIAAHRQDRKIRLWSAGCSSGEEPYSIAITCREALGEALGWDVKILATDLSTRMLRLARTGIYDASRMREMSPGMIARYFDEGPEGFALRDPVRRMVNFAHLNLMSPWPMKGLFDVIFCRNVLIYFDKPTQAMLIERFWNQLRSGGTLFLGHSESLAGVRHRFRYVQPTLYEKP